MRAHNQLSGIEADPPPQQVPGRHCFEPFLELGGGPAFRHNSFSPFSSSADSSDAEQTCVQPAGLISDGRFSAAREGQLYRVNILDIPAVMLYDFCIAFPTLLHEWMWLV